MRPLVPLNLVHSQSDRDLSNNSNNQVGNFEFFAGMAETLKVRVVIKHMPE